MATKSQDYLEILDDLDSLSEKIPSYLPKPSYLLNLLKTQDDLESLISRLEKLEIIRENPIKYWDRNKVYCKLNIINPDLTIKAQGLRYKNVIRQLVTVESRCR